MKTLSFILLLFIFTVSVFSQSTLTGIIVDNKTSEPLEFANISLLKSDSTFVKGTITDDAGKFSFSDISPNNNYLVSIACLGYKKNYVETNKKGDMGNIALSTSDVSLSTVTIEGNAVIQKVDRQVITPSASQIKASTSGISLIQNLQLPRISIDPMNNSIKVTGGGEAQLRINGILAENTEIIALRPEDIIRIDYHDSPGLRYGGAEIVLDFITRRRESGGSISTNLQHGLHSNLGFAEDNFAAKTNHKKSEFSTNVSQRFRKINWKRENTERFVFPDYTMSRLEEGEPTKFERRDIHTHLNYSLVEQDKYYFNVALRYGLDNSPNDFKNRISKVHSSTDPDPMEISDLSSSKAKKPSLDLYLQKNLKNDQILVFNAVATYIRSDNDREYMEQPYNRSLESIRSVVDGKKYSLILQGVYEKSFEKSKISGGIWHLQSYTNNIYNGNTAADIGMVAAHSKLYFEYQMKRDKFNYVFGLAGERSYYSQDNAVKTFHFQPKVNISYNISDKSYLKYSSHVGSSSSSLADMNDLDQDIDPIQIRRGNPYLKSNWFIENTISSGYKFGMFGVDLWGRYNYDHKPIMSETYLEKQEDSGEYKFIQTKDNQVAFHRFQAEANLKIQPWKEHITISVRPGIHRGISKGHNYTHTNTKWYIDASLNANYKNVMFNMEWFSRRNWLTGETIYGGERGQVMSAGYKREKWSLSFGSIFPFVKNYKNTEWNLSKLTPSTSQISSKDLTPMFFLNFTCNLNFGRQYNSGNKKINNSDSDSGIMSGSK